MSVIFQLDDGLPAHDLLKGALYSLSYDSACVHLDPTDNRDDYRYGTTLRLVEGLEYCYERHTAMKVRRRDLLLCLGKLRLVSYVAEQLSDTAKPVVRIFNSYHTTAFLFGEYLICFSGATFREAGPL
ncbi:MAG: hypothetical protein WC761_00045 [Candidatus Paceibacterota bacterium]|jgi:hypothetical protein